MINGIKPKVLKCSRCDDTMPSQRLDMGFNEINLDETDLSFLDYFIELQN